MTREEDSSDGSSGVRRRDLLATMGASGGIATLAGCQDLFTQTRRYVADPARLDSQAGALGFSLANEQQIQTTRQASIGGSTVDLEIISHVARYSGSPTDFGIAATPQVEEGGQVLNPVARASLSDLVTGKEGGAYISKTPLGDRSWKRGPFREDQRSGTLLGQQATLETYAGITDGGELALVSIARVVDDGDAVIVGGSRSWTPSSGSKQALNGVSNDQRFADHISKIIKTMPHVIRSTGTVTQSATPTATKAGVQKAAGADFAPASQGLYFVQRSGELVRYNAIRGVERSLASGTATIQGTWHFNFDNGVGGGASRGEADGAESDVWWRIRDSTDRWLVPENGAEIAYLGNVDYDDVAPESLPSYDYTTDHLEVTKSGSTLVADTVFVVKTSEGNFAKAEVVQRGPNRKLELNFETYELAPKLEVIGTGYNVPDDIELVGDGTTAYVTERGVPPAASDGKLLKVDLTNADRSAATVVASGFGIPHQIALEAGKNQAHVVTDTKVVRIDLGSGSTTDVYTGLKKGKGILLDDHDPFIYVTDQNTGPNAGWLKRINLSTGRSEKILTGVSQGFHLTWANPSQSAIVVPDNGPGSITVYDLVDDRVSSLVSSPPSEPTSVEFVGDDGGYIVGESVIQEFDLAAGVFGTAGPMFKGIGHIPVSDITQQPSVPEAEAGYANTSGPAYPLEVDEAPFGGRLPLKFDHYEAYVNNSARYYRVFVDGDVERRPWHGLKWDASKGEFDGTKITPDGDGYFDVRKPGTVWFRSDMGYQLPTGDLADGLHDLRVAFYGSTSSSSKIAETKLQFRVDNAQPTADLGRIFHRLSGGTEEVVSACAIVDKPDNAFKFEVTAHDDEKHLRAWRLRALWGDGKSDTFQKETFSTNGSGSDWAGPVNQKVGDGSGGYWSAKQKRCAHTFFLHAWGRTINGHHYIHRDGDHKSLTFLLP